MDGKPLESPKKFAGYRGDPEHPEAILLVNHGLHVELVFDRTHFIGKHDQAGLADVQLESAMTAIMDCEDSVAAVDADDKVLVYQNWLGLMRGDLAERVTKGDKDLYAAPGRGSALFGARWRGSDPEGAGADVGPQRRPPDDQSGDAGPRRRRGFRRVDGCDDHNTDRDPRPEARQRQFGAWLGLCGQTKDARARGSGLYGRDFFQRGECAGLAKKHCKNRHHGRGTAHDREPQGMHSCCEIASRVHQHRVSGPHRRRNSHLDGSRGLFAQGFHQAKVVDRRLRGPERRYRAGVRACRARRRSARACGRCPT